MTRPDEMLAFHDGLFGGHAFLGLEGGRIHFSNGTHYSVNADGGVTWSEPYPGLDNGRRYWPIRISTTRTRRDENASPSRCAQSRSHSRSSRRAEAGHNMDFPMGWKEVFGTRMP